MSSICGIFYRDGRHVEPPEIDRMLDVLSHWKPDRTGAWREGEMGFGHLALWTTPEAVTENCPFREPESGVTVTADARIDNREDLIGELNLHHRPPGEIGDAELIAQAYRKWGEDCAIHLIGDFAFAVWDPQARRLFCARDPMGIRPFYYFVDDKRFIFGTEIKAIFTTPNIPREWNPLRFALFLLAGKMERDHTQFRSILALESASALMVTGSGMRKWRYWRLNPELEIRFPRDEDYVDAFEEIFQKAVDARLRSITRVGSMLSGGLDATTMLRFATQSQKLSRNLLSAYTWALEKQDDWPIRDEREYVDAYLAEYPVEHHYLVPNPGQMFDDLPEIRHLQDGPAWDISTYMTRLTFETARNQNIRVLLFGDGGDEVASYEPHNHLVGLILKRNWPALASEVRTHASRAGAPTWKAWKNYVICPLLKANHFSDPFGTQGRFAGVLQVLEQREQITAIAEDLVRTCGIADYLASIRSRPNRPWRHPVRLRQIEGITGSNLFADLATIKLNISVLSSVECRFPYLDRRVIDYCVAMPQEQHRQEGWGRRLLRRAAVRHIPAKIAWRRDKSSTRPDFERGIFQNEEDLKRTFERWSGDSRITSHVDVGRLQTSLGLIVRHPNGTATWQSSITAPAFCRAVHLATFLEKTSIPANSQAP